MIPPNPTPWEPRVWRTELARAIRSSTDLLTYVGTELADATDLPAFATLVPRGFADRMQKGDPDDPLLLQVLGREEETREVPGFSFDPLEELGFNPVEGLLHKYHGRALLIATGACAVNCRYCFRRHFPYAEQREPQLQGAVAKLAADESIKEIILSGGDPLLLDDPALGELLDALAEIPHVTRLRLHTRIPIVLPERTTAALLDRLSNGRFRTALVAHANHARELTDETARAFACFSRAGVALFNQAVLLRGVNDTVEAQVSLAECLYEQSVLPYYLHMPDAVAGTHHFAVSDAAAKSLHRAMQSELPGYLLPRLVREEPGAPAKTHI